MQNQAAHWITLDDTGLTLHIPPIPESLTTILWLAAFAGLLLAILAAPKAWAHREKPAKLWRAVTGSLQGHYVTALILFGIVLTAWALYNYIWQIPVLIGEMLDRMKATLGRSDPPAESDDIRNIAYAFAALAGMLAILATIPFQLVRVWINERSARNAEENLTTGLINTAVEGLGAEKTVSRIGRVVTVEFPDDTVRTEIQWYDEDRPEFRTQSFIGTPGEWQSFDRTEPNLEVRIGAILTLERIARDNPPDHIRVMDILCAYIRENAKAREVAPPPSQDEHPIPRRMEVEHFKPLKESSQRRLNVLRHWVDALPKPRADIQVALKVIGRRSRDHIANIEAAHSSSGKKGEDLEKPRHFACRLIQGAYMDGGGSDGQIAGIV